jgi:penicillin-binding protein 1C
VTRELTVAAWAGTFDGTATQGLVAMHAAAPLVRAGLLAAAGGRDLSLPVRPDQVETGYVCPVSGLRPGPDCPHQKLEHFARGHAPGETCSWHQHGGAIRYPAIARAWAERTAGRGGRQITAAR